MGSRAFVMAALAASSVLLVGCVPHSAFPESMTQAEVQDLIAAQNAMWWESIAPGEPQPEIEPIEYVKPGTESTLVVECMVDSGIPGLTSTGDGSYTYDGDQDDLGPLNRQQFICQQLYPYDSADPPALGYFTVEQIAWFNNDVKRRLVPCLRRAGFTVSTSGDDSQFTWVPYFEMQPMPRNADEWAQVDLLCPPPPYGAAYRPYDERN